MVAGAQLVRSLLYSTALHIRAPTDSESPGDVKLESTVPYARLRRPLPPAAMAEFRATK